MVTPHPTIGRWVLAACCLIGATHPALAQVHEHEWVVSAIEPANSPAGLASARTERLRQERFAIAALALLGIALTGAVAIVAILAFGQRLRRLSRQPLPTQHQGPQFWYLRPDPPNKSS